MCGCIVIVASPAGITGLTQYCRAMSGPQPQPCLTFKVKVLIRVVAVMVLVVIVVLCIVD